MNMEPVRFGVIGCGLMGREFASVSMRWLHLACELPRPVIVAACDLSPKNLDWFRQVPDTKYFYSDAARHRNDVRRLARGERAVLAVHDEEVKPTALQYFRNIRACKCRHHGPQYLLAVFQAFF